MEHKNEKREKRNGLSRQQEQKILNLTPREGTVGCEMMASIFFH